MQDGCLYFVVAIVNSSHESRASAVRANTAHAVPLLGIDWVLSPACTSALSQTRRAPNWPISIWYSLASSARNSRGSNVATRATLAAHARLFHHTHSGHCPNVPSRSPSFADACKSRIGASRPRSKYRSTLKKARTDGCRATKRYLSSRLRKSVTESEATTRVASDHSPGPSLPSTSTYLPLGTMTGLPLTDAMWKVRARRWQ